MILSHDIQSKIQDNSYKNMKLVDKYFLKNISFWFSNIDSFCSGGVHSFLDDEFLNCSFIGHHQFANDIKQSISKKKDFLFLEVNKDKL